MKAALLVNQEHIDTRAFNQAWYNIKEKEKICGTL